MEKDQIIGALILVASIAGILVYGWLLFLVSAVLVLQITAFVGVSMILGILAWIGWTMATTPPPAPIEEVTTPPAPEAQQTSAEKEAQKQG